MENASTKLKPTRKEQKKEGDKPEMKQTLSRPLSARSESIQYQALMMYFMYHWANQAESWSVI